MIFDTGAANYLTADAAPRFHVAIFGGLNLSGVGSSSTTGGFATIRSISLDSAELRDETVIVGPSPFPRQNGHPAPPEGVIGYEFLSEFRTTLDYAGKTITFSRFEDPTTATGTTVPFYSNMGAGILQCYRITFDYRARTITFESKPDSPNCGRGAAVSAE